MDFKSIVITNLIVLSLILFGISKRDLENKVDKNSRPSIVEDELTNNKIRRSVEEKLFTSEEFLELAENIPKNEISILKSITLKCAQINEIMSDPKKTEEDDIISTVADYEEINHCLMILYRDYRGYRLIQKVDELTNNTRERQMAKLANSKYMDFKIRTRGFTVNTKEDCLKLYGK